LIFISSKDVYGEDDLSYLPERESKVSNLGGQTLSIEPGSPWAICYKILQFVRDALRRTLSIHTQNVWDHLKSLSLAKRTDCKLASTEEKYHLYMLEIELVNRISREDFKRYEYRCALIAHCLRDFRPRCRSVKGNIEAVCRGCTEDCFVRLGSVLLEKYGIKPYISVEIDQERLFRRLKQEHSSIGALGIACIPELAMGMRLCIRRGIPPVDSIGCESMFEVDVTGS
jgi:hypothetical protein